MRKSAIAPNTMQAKPMGNCMGILNADFGTKSLSDSIEQGVYLFRITIPMDLQSFRAFQLPEGEILELCFLDAFFRWEMNIDK